MIIDSGDRMTFSKTDFSDVKKIVHCGNWFLVISRDRSLFNLFDRETFSYPPPRRRSAFSSWCLCGYCVAFVSSNAFAQVRSRFLCCESTHPPKCPSLPRAHTAPDGAHPVAPPSDQDPDAPPRPRRPPSVVGAVRASVQRFRKLLRKTGVAWSAREVRSVSFPFTSLSSLSSPSAGTAWEQRYPEFLVLDRNHRVCRAPQRYVVSGRLHFSWEGIAKSFAVALKQ